MVMNRIIQHLKSSDHVLLASHLSPDGDAIGSLLAMGIALNALGIRTTLFNESPIPAVYRFLPSVNRIRSRIEDIHLFDTAVILDCGDIIRIGKNADAVQQLPAVVNIDHHITNTRFGQMHLIDTAACATAEIVYRIIKRAGLFIDEALATAIYTGIFTDTGSFRFSNTNKEAFSICDEMVARGADPYTVAKNVYGTYSLGRIKLLNLALDSLEISCNGKLSLMILTRDMFDETGTRSEDVDGMINYGRRIRNVRVAALVQEHMNGRGPEMYPKRYHVSLRSDGSVDVAEIAAHFGGGGHRDAAGFNIESRVGDIRKDLFDLAEKIT